MVTLSVYFTNLPRYAIGTEPYEDAVTRTVPTTGSLPEEVLTQLFLGPTDDETAQGLDVFLSGATGFSELTIADDVARVYLTGECNSKGATYTIANSHRSQSQAVPGNPVGQDLRPKWRDGDSRRAKRLHSLLPGAVIITVTKTSRRLSCGMLV